MTTTSKTPRAKSHSALPCHTTFAKASGERPFDWNRALREVTPRSRVRLARLSQLSGWWVTCACGNLCELLPRHETESAFSSHMNGEPKDYLLGRLGYQFHDRVKALAEKTCEGAITPRQFDRLRRSAQVTLAKIETRSGVLIRGILREAARTERALSS